MRTTLALLILSALALPARAETPAKTEADAPAPALAFTMKRLDGSAQDLAEYHGRVVLIVNTASRCGLTPQYKDLQEIYDRYRERGLVILGFPSNDFAGQEPGSDEEIAEFCRANYGVTFPMFSKIHVRGEEQHPLYAHLTGLPEPLGGEIRWNFQKFLVDRSGRVAARFAPRVRPTDAELIAAIEELL